ncbi:hypothetical protein HPB49_007776 [Dermacentor silvarum]|uniref:Uncharacterized protein n=1 Tax=Dermacentor silvarum TaxID=543639 RepID=A0ACB8DXA3_DERSI|nr:hypothetical protein HPB49_007776 [Dermacentor silvarum]
MLTGAWWTVRPTTIVNCSQKAGLHTANWTAVAAYLEGEGYEELSDRLGTDSPLPFEDYATSDSQVESCATVTTEEILTSVLSREEEEPTLPEDTPKISAKETLMCLEKLKSFAAQLTFVLEKVHESLDTMIQFMTTAVLSTQVQQKITTISRKC